MSQIEILTETRCVVCGIAYSMPTHLLDLRTHDGLSFFCPNGHAQSFKENDSAKAKRHKTEAANWQAEAQRLLEECDSLRSQLAAAKRGISEKPKRRWFAIR